MKKTLFYLTIVAIALASCKDKTTKTNDPVIYMPADDKALEMAKQEAISNLDHFIQVFTKSASDTSYQFSVKTDFVENSKHEHMWILVTNIKGDSLEGMLGNNPEIVTDVKYGDFVAIHKNQLEDWIIYNAAKDTLEGGYSIQVLEKAAK